MHRGGIKFDKTSALCFHSYSLSFSPSLTAIKTETLLRRYAAWAVAARKDQEHTHCYAHRTPPTLVGGADEHKPLPVSVAINIKIDELPRARQNGPEGFVWMAWKIDANAAAAALEEKEP